MPINAAAKVVAERITKRLNAIHGFECSALRGEHEGRLILSFDNQSVRAFEKDREQNGGAPRMPSSSRIELQEKAMALILEETQDLRTVREANNESIRILVSAADHPDVQARLEAFAQKLESGDLKDKLDALFAEYGIPRSDVKQVDKGIV